MYSYTAKYPLCLNASHKFSGPSTMSQEKLLAGLFSVSTCRAYIPTYTTLCMYRAHSYAEYRSVKQLQQCCEHSLFVVRASCMICTPSYTSITLKARQTSYTSACYFCFVHLSIVCCCWLQACMSSACCVLSTVLVGLHAGCGLTC